MRVLYGSLAVAREWHDIAGLTRTIEAWRDAAPELLPTVADDHEPVRRKFDPDDLDGALAPWSTRFWIASRTLPNVRVNFLGSHGATNSTAHINIPVRGARSPYIGSLERLVLRLCEVWKPDLACVHALSDGEAAEAIAKRRPDIIVTNRLSLAAEMSVGFTKQLEKGLPTLYWVTVFGPRYVDLFGRERLLRAPWASVVEADYGILGRITEEPPNDESWPKFRASRDAVIEALGPEAFWPSAGRVPDLSLLPPET
jgi:hypothetical protein